MQVCFVVVTDMTHKFSVFVCKFVSRMRIVPLENPCLVILIDDSGKRHKLSVNA